MKGHEKLFTQGDLVHSMVSPNERPDLLIPLKASILEGDYQKEDPLYRVRPIKFYDDLEFLRKTFGVLRFKPKLDRNPPLPLKISTEFTTEQEFIDELHRVNATFVVRDSMTFRHKKPMLDLYRKMEDYLVAKMLREWRERSERTPYNGIFSLAKDGEWRKRFEDAMADRIEKNGADPERIISDLVSSPINREKHKLRGSDGSGGGDK